jgi:hypothetical protein
MVLKDAIGFSRSYKSKTTWFFVCLEKFKASSICTEHERSRFPATHQEADGKRMKLDQRDQVREWFAGTPDCNFDSGPGKFCVLPYSRDSCTEYLEADLNDKVALATASRHLCNEWNFNFWLALVVIIIHHCRLRQIGSTLSGANDAYYSQVGEDYEFGCHWCAVTPSR